MSEYDKELQSGTKEYEKAMKEKRSAKQSDREIEKLKKKREEPGNREDKRRQR